MWNLSRFTFIQLFWNDSAFSGNYSKLSKLLKDNYFKFLEESVFDIMNKGNKSASWNDKLDLEV